MPWPAVLVTTARSTDGVTLDLALRPNREAAVNGLTLTFSSLTPGAAYTFAGQSLTAGADGNGAVTLDLTAPLVARLEPAK